MKRLLLIMATAWQTFAAGQVPLLNSFPEAQPTILLDFDGHTVDNTAWNYNGPIVCNPSGLTTAQLTEVFNRVSEDYKSFTVNVTTDQQKFDNAPVNQRIRAIVTTSYEWYGIAGGVAFVGSFTWGDDTPCFIFSSLHNYNTKNIAEAASHEIGHTLGLFHQALYNVNCEKLTDYNTGVGSGETGWAPIMGVGYYRNLTTWNYGPTPDNCNAMQDDKAIIASTINGIAIRQDDNDNSIQHAPLLNPGGGNFTGAGIIERGNDEDLYKFRVTVTSRFVLSARPLSAGTGNSGADCDLMLELFNAGMSLVKSSNPPDSLSAAVDTVLVPGTYYFRLKTVANSFIATTYGMAGAYQYSGQVSPYISLPLNSISLKGTRLQQNHILAWQVDADEPVNKRALEYSRGNSPFTTLRYLTADTGNYSYSPAENTGMIRYRIRVTLNDNREYVSNTVVLSTEKTSNLPLIINTISAQDNFEILSSAGFTYALFDLGGQLLKSGSLDNGITTIRLMKMPSQIYFIVFRNAAGQPAGSGRLIVQ